MGRLKGGLPVPEHGDELWGEQLWPQGPDLRNIAQQPQHVAVELLFVRELLEETRNELLSITVTRQD